MLSLLSRSDVFKEHGIVTAATHTGVANLGAGGVVAGTHHKTMSLGGEDASAQALYEAIFKKAESALWARHAAARRLYCQEGLIIASDEAPNNGVALRRAMEVEELVLQAGGRTKPIVYVCFGDWAQLPPVDKMNGSGDEKVFFFEEEIFKRRFKVFATGEVRRNFRVGDGDPGFMRLLEIMREGLVGPGREGDAEVVMAIEELREMEGKPMALSDVIPTLIVPMHKVGAERNRTATEALPGVGVRKVMSVQMVGPRSASVAMKVRAAAGKVVTGTKEAALRQLGIRMDAVVVVKEGSQIMSVLNLSHEPMVRVDDEWVLTGEDRVAWTKGMRGVVVGFYDGNAVVQTVHGERLLVGTASVRHDKGDDEVKVLQVPYILAWAMTAHCVQGMTLDAVEVAINDDFYEEGQVYVAVSRATSKSALKVSQFDPSKVKAYTVVRQWHLRLAALRTVVKAEVVRLAAMEGREEVVDLTEETQAQDGGDDDDGGDDGAAVDEEIVREEVVDLTGDTQAEDWGGDDGGWVEDDNNEIASNDENAGNDDNASSDDNDNANTDNDNDSWEGGGRAAAPPMSESTPRKAPVATMGVRREKRRKVDTSNWENVIVLSSGGEEDDEDNGTGRPNVVVAASGEECDAWDEDTGIGKSSVSVDEEDGGVCVDDMDVIDNGSSMEGDAWDSQLTVTDDELM